ncbi:MAG TPA: ATP-binding protein [Streptomyces sp.]
MAENGVSALDSLLRWERYAWGVPAGLDGDGFAALRFDATPHSVSRTRRFLRSTLTGWQLHHLVDDATTIAAELVANAVTHALCSPALPPNPTAWLALVRMERAVVCAVADPSPELPAIPEPEPFAESGRGLRIVAELSDSWGHSPAEPVGKTVWARLTSTAG